MYQLINQYNPVTGQFGLANTPEARNAYLREAEMRNTDWFDTLFPTISHKIILSVSLPEQKIFILCFIKCHVRPGVVQAK